MQFSLATLGRTEVIDLLTLNCGCRFDNGSWDLCLFHRYKKGAVNYDGPIPLSGIEEEVVPECPTPVPEAGSGVRSIFDTASDLDDPYSASTRQARAEREARKIAIANRLNRNEG